jgi:anti-anti-sigma regulatory factor
MVRALRQRGGGLFRQRTGRESDHTGNESRRDLTDARRIADLFRACARDIDAAGQRAALNPVASAAVVIDLTATQLVDTKLVACLIAVLRRARRRGVRLEVHASPAVLQWLDVCRLRDVM